MVSPSPLTATVTPSFGGTATGTVTFSHGATVLGTATLSGNVAKLSLSTLTVGTRTITATYGGNTEYLTSTSSVLSQVVNAASTTTTLTSSLNPSKYGESITLTATVTPSFGGTATGTVTFSHGATVLGTATLSGNVAKLTLTSLAVGTRTITATYGGMATEYLTSTSSVLSQVVNAASTTTTLTSSLNPSSMVSPSPLTATVTPSFGGTATGTVTFSHGATVLGTATLSGNVAKLSLSTLAVGTRTITATYGGNTELSHQHFQRASTGGRRGVDHHHPHLFE